MDPGQAPYAIEINGHLGVTVLSAFSAMVSESRVPHTLLTGLLDRSALYGVLAQIEALGLELIGIRRLTPENSSRSPHIGQRNSAARRDIDG